MAREACHNINNECRLFLHDWRVTRCIIREGRSKVAHINGVMAHCHDTLEWPGYVECHSLREIFDGPGGPAKYLSTGPG